MDDHDYGRLLVLGHYDQPRLAGIQPMLEQRAQRRPFEVVSAPDGVPDALADDVRGVLVMGGMMGVPEIDQMPWMADEVELLRTAREREVPVLGVCLGAQLLAHAHGGAVARRDVPEIGLFALGRTEQAADDPVFAGFPDGSAVALTHKDDVAELPPDATPMLLATGSGPAAAGTPAWTLGETVHAVQFHPEVTPELLQFWLANGLDEAAERAGVDAAELVEEVTRQERFLRATGLSLVGRWIDAVVGKGDPSPRKHRKKAA